MESFMHKEIEGKTFVCAKDVANYLGKKNASEFAKYHFKDHLKKVDRKFFIERAQVEEFLDKQSKTREEKSKDLERQYRKMYETKVKEIEKNYQQRFEEEVAYIEGRLISLQKNYQMHMQIITRNDETTIDHIWYHLRECPCNTKPRFFDEEIKEEIARIKAIKWESRF